MSRDRTTPIPRAVTPRDERLARVEQELRDQGGEWAWARTVIDEQLALGQDVAELIADRDAKRKTIGRLKALVGGSLGTAVLAAATALYGFGVRQGLSEAAEAQAAEYRARVLELERSDRRQDIDIGNLRGLLRALDHTGDD